MLKYLTAHRFSLHLESVLLKLAENSEDSDLDFLKAQVTEVKFPHDNHISVVFRDDHEGRLITFLSTLKETQWSLAGELALVLTIYDSNTNPTHFRRFERAKLCGLDLGGFAYVDSHAVSVTANFVYDELRIVR